MDPEEKISETNLLETGLLDNVAVGLAYLSLNGRFLLANKHLQESLGYSEETFKTLMLDEITHPLDVDKLSLAIQELLNQNTESQALEIRCFNSTGNTCWVRLVLSGMPNKQGEVIYLIAVIENIQISNTHNNDPIFNRKLFAIIADNIPNTLWLSSVDLKTLHYANQAFLDTWQITQEQIDSGEDIDLLKNIHPDDYDTVRNLFKQGFANENHWDQNFRLINPDGSISFIEDHGTIIRDEAGNPIFLLGTNRDVTERVQYTAQLENLNQELQSAYEEVIRVNQFDSLTSCYNRSAILDSLSNSYYQFKRYDIPCSIIYIDLNKFKQVNDKYGHFAGDLVLKSFVLHIQELIRQSDVLGRMGGDEFLLLFPGTTRYNAEQFLKKEKQEFTTQISKDIILPLSYSVGVSELDFNMATIDEWIDAADKAMYAQKE